MTSKARSAGAGGWNILIVEDNWLIGIEMEATLSEAGFSVVGVARNVKDALRLCRQKRPQVVLMDVMLAGGDDGIDAAVEIRQRYGIPSVFVTAHGDSATRARAEPAEPLGWIVKPIVSAELVRRLAAIQRSLQG
ncbi:MAG TPA: response regulator [Woeseiaceae bacterium]|nr:response regulator [Woeseiaceae bacterium]